MAYAAAALLLLGALALVVRRKIRKPPIHKGMGPRLELVPVHEVVRLNVPALPRRERRTGSSGPHRLPAGGGR